MSNEQKLREHLREVIDYARESGHDWLCLVEAEQALCYKQNSALERYKSSTVEQDEPCPVERLRYFLSLSLKDTQDWFDVEPFLDAIKPELPYQNDENLGYLADIRDAAANMFPCESEDLLMMAIGSPSEVPGYLIAVLNAANQDSRRLDDLRRNAWSLCSFVYVPASHVDRGIGWRVVERSDRAVSMVFDDDPRAAIDSAMQKVQS